MSEIIQKHAQLKTKKIHMAPLFNKEISETKKNRSENQRGYGKRQNSRVIDKIREKFSKNSTQEMHHDKKLHPFYLSSHLCWN